MALPMTNSAQSFVILRHHHQCFRGHRRSAVSTQSVAFHFLMSLLLLHAKWDSQFEYKGEQCYGQEEKKLFTTSHSSYVHLFAALRLQREKRKVIFS